MSIVSFLKGVSTKLSSAAIADGKLIFTTDDEKLYIDHDNLDTEGNVSSTTRSCINPNPDWNATSGNAVIQNKPTFVTNLTQSEDTVTVDKSDGTTSTITVSSSSVTKGTNGSFVKSGIVGYYQLTEDLVLASLDAGSTYELDTIPAGFYPNATSSKIAIADNAQLTESLLIRFDKSTNKVLIMNNSGSQITNTTLMASTYDYIVATSSS